MTDYDKRIIFAALATIACFLYMMFSEDKSDFAKSIIFVIITFYFGSSDKKGKGGL